jgi:hypothetical protein
MKRLCGWVALVFAVALMPPPAFAHMPYFQSESAPVTLLDGSPGTLRLLNGDGILGPDPTRPVVTDAQDGVRALGPEGYAVAQSCGASGCRVYVYSNTALLPHVYELDPGTMRSTPTIRTDTEDSRANIMMAKDIYGFRTVEGLGARMIGALTCLVQWWPSFVILMLIGLSAIPVWKCLGMALSRAEDDRWGAAMFGVVFAIGVTLPMLGFWFLFLLVSAYPPLLSLVALGIPSAIMALYSVLRLARGRTRVPA